MNITATIARHLLEVHTGGNWTEVWISKTLEDVSYEEALRQTPGSVNTIASLLHHITFYNRVILQRLRGTEPFINAANGFNLPSLQNDADWNRLKEDNQQSARELADAIKELTDDMLEQPILPVQGPDTYYRQLHGVVEHAHYHLGQIVILKNLIRNQ